MKGLVLLLAFFMSNTYSLSDLEKMLKEANPEVGVADAEVRVNLTKLDSVLHKKFTPEFEGTFVVGPVPRARGDILEPEDKTGDIEGLGPFFKVEIELFQPLYTFGRIKNAEKAVKAGVKASEWEKKRILFDNLKRLKKAYLTYLYLTEMEKFMEELEESYEKVYSRAETLYEKDTGDVTQNDMLRLETFGEMLKARKRKLEMEIDKVKSLIKFLCGLNGEVNLKTLPLPFVKFEDKGEDFYLQNALNNRVEVKSLNYIQKTMELKLKAVKAEYFPVVFFGGKFGYSVAPNRTPQTNPWAYEQFNYIMVGGVIGLKQDFDFYHTKDKVDEAKAKLEKVKAELFALKMGIKEEVRADYLSVKKLKDMLEALSRAMKKTKTLFLSTLLNYEMGVEEIKEVIDRFKDYIEAKTGYLTGILQYDLKAVDLMFSSGLYETPLF